LRERGGLKLKRDNRRQVEHLMSKSNGPSLHKRIDFDCNAARLPTMQAMPRPLQTRSSLVRRLVQAQDDPGKQRIQAWLRELDDKHLSNLGLTFEDIAVLRDTQTPSSSGRRAMARQTAAWRQPPFAIQEASEQRGPHGTNKKR
jgi:hypothetical protein